MEVIFAIVVLVVVVLVTRLFGAWMLRIDVVIDNQRAILREMKRANGEIEKKADLSAFKPEVQEA